jgi:methyltransferase
MTSVLIFVFVVLPFLLLENMRSRINERALRRQGAIEPPGDPYIPIAVVYVGGFVAMALEGWWRGGASRPWLALGLATFTLSKLIKLWVVRALGPLWSFRILVLPGRPLVASGPYRYFRHPNYIGLFLEFLGAATMMRAPVAGAVTAVLFWIFLRQRIAVEERALGLRPLE